MSETTRRYRAVRASDNSLKIIEALPDEYGVPIAIAFKQAAAFAHWGAFQPINPELISK